MNDTWLITGGTGSFGQAITKTILNELEPKSIRILSRGELLQSQMESKFNDKRLRFFIGDVRDRDRLNLAMRGCDIVIHAAALKRVEIAEYNPRECLLTNCIGSINVFEIAIENNVSKIIALSSDKGCHAVNLYGMTKAVMERLAIQYNTFSRGKTKISCTRWGNILSSRGSVITIFKEQAKSGEITITDTRMTRFLLSLDQAVHFLINCTKFMRGGEIFVLKSPSVNIIDMAKIIGPQCKIRITGIRPGEKLHETLLTSDEARHTQEQFDFYTIIPEFNFWSEDTYIDKTGNPLPEGFELNSLSAGKLSKEELELMLKE